MKLTITRWCLTLFIFLNHPTPILPYSENETVTPTMEPDMFVYILGRKKMMDAQYKCYDRMEQLPPYQGDGPFCNRTWDGWTCWDDTPAGVLAFQHCPDYFPDFDPTETVTKYCDENGDWYKHPENNRTWSNYSMCNAFTPEKLQNAYNLYYLAIVGHSMSIFALVISLAIFVIFKNLSCQRVTLHKNMFLTYILNSMIIIIHLVEVVPNGELVREDPLSCKILHFFHQYMMSCNYFWMLCEGIYLHTLIVVAVFTDKQYMRWYYLLGWGFPLVPTTIHAVTRALYFNDNCWLSVETHLLYIIHGPVMAALVVNFFFLLNIVRVLVKKLRRTQEAESQLYLKAVRATLILVPLLGVQFVVFPWRPSNKVLGVIYDYVMHSLIHFQGFFVAIIYCFYNNEVQTTLKRQWAKFQAQWGYLWGDDSPRSYPIHTSASAAARAAARAAANAAAEGGDIPVYICHHEPKNQSINLGEVAEAMALEVIEQESSA